MTGEERSRLEVIEAKVDTILVKLAYIEKAASDHEDRLRSVERWKLSIPISMLLVAATIVGALVNRGG